MKKSILFLFTTGLLILGFSACDDPIFDPTGNGDDDIVMNDDDDDGGFDDDDGGMSGGDCCQLDLLSMVRPWLDANLGSYQIDEVECEDFCDGTTQIEVELENVEEEYYFDLMGEFLYSLLERDTSVIPQSVLDAVESVYPGFRLDDDEVDVLTFADGTVAYEFEIEIGNDDDDIDLLVDEAGNILCVD